MPRSPLIDCCTPVAQPTLSPSAAVDLERLFKALADRNRVRILNLLVSAGEAVCVCALTPTLGLSQATVSYHLKLLVEAGLLERERRGRFAFYRVVPGALDRVGDLVSGSAVELSAA